jgi:beta-glucanase (GH16 family)
MRPLLLAMMIGLLADAALADEPARQVDGYRLVWADEFDKDGSLDEKDWVYERGFVRNHEHQWYQPENATCRGGFLVIEGRREKKPNPAYEVGSRDWRRGREHIEYTSTSVMTRGKHAWKYGRFEMRARIDTRPGLWPAFWTLGTAGPWPANGEIDIMEFYRGMLLANVAWGTDRRNIARWDTVKKPIAEFKDPEWSKAFHVWRMDWDEKAIKLYVDGELLNETDLAETINGDAGRRNPFKQEHYLLMNLAIGGDNGGDPSATEFPAKFEIDYVRVYQKE